MNYELERMHGARQRAVQCLLFIREFKVHWIVEISMQPNFMMDNSLW